MTEEPQLPSPDCLFALADALEAFREEFGSELNTLAWDDVNTYEIQIRTAANILSDVGVAEYLYDIVEWAEVVLAGGRDCVSLQE